MPGDGRLLSDAVNSSYEHLATFMPWARPYQSEEESEKLVCTFRARYLLAEDFTFGIFSRDGRQLLGGSGFHLRQGSLKHRAAEIGMWIRASQAGKGLGTAALRALLDWGFTQWPWERLVWRASARNLASQRVAEKVGLVREGVQRGYHRLEDGSRDDLVNYSILRHEWNRRVHPNG
ncbi:MAG: GNAT family N-acetyltransferase [Chloroflexota bacterium]|nr:GNAT family N-acetyltransferase [Chloroflexota bacterium]